MDVALLTAFATPFMAMLAMLWHQQRAILRKVGENGERLSSYRRLPGHRNALRHSLKGTRSGPGSQASRRPRQELSTGSSCTGDRAGMS